MMMAQAIKTRMVDPPVFDPGTPYNTLRAKAVAPGTRCNKK
jgi:hypothetical protein